MIKCPVCGCAKMIWEKETPTDIGIYYYWDDYLKKDQVLTVQVSNSVSEELMAETLTQSSDFYFYRHIDTLKGEWIGPLPLPRKRK